MNAFVLAALFDLVACRDQGFERCLVFEADFLTRTPVYDERWGDSKWEHREVPVGGYTENPQFNTCIDQVIRVCVERAAHQEQWGKKP